MAKKFQPKRGATIATLIAFLVLELLGTWQVHRLHWKEALLQNIHERMAQQAVPLPEKIDAPAQWEYRRVTLAGRFLNDHEFLIKPRMMDGQPGYHMLVPFWRLSGGIVFVDRGWISDDLLKQATRPKGTVQVEGIVQLAAKPHFAPDNNPAKNDWYWPDVAAMTQAAALKNPSPVIVSVSVREENVYPAGGQLRLDIPNDHKQYAIFWYLMALVLLGVYFLAHWKEEER